ncbi:hypothetical protein RX717_09770 [Intestinibacillus sp. NTUH-41-i26]|uniref:hypothetical protein n=1 Tax=Butyricicoccaceae TaxID=3085642 RepID=UPI000D1F2F83|nr:MULTISPECIES: hypothetical protein [Butyricicoccaceae]WOC74307.1 hypothetical protein RX717_09770 [Intestinibacillus sp. NTUH-41-i26]
MDKTELNSKVKDLRELRRMSEEIAAEIEAITDTIKREMTAQGVDMLTGDDWKATWKPVQSARFDSKAFKVAMPDLYERFTRSAETRRFVLA